jgi:hypothetical protein
VFGIRLFSHPVAFVCKPAILSWRFHVGSTGLLGPSFPVHGRHAGWNRQDVSKNRPENRQGVFAQQLRQLGDIHRNAPRLVTGDVSERPPIDVGQ